MAHPPNILIILTDQLAQRAVGAYGDAQRRTPNIDLLAARGVRFADAYTPTPICMPARASLWTGQLPHKTGIQGNGKLPPIPADMPTLGLLFSQAGYECRHFGKRHDHESLRGFICAEELWTPKNPVAPTPPWKTDGDALQDTTTTEQILEFLDTKPKTPLLMVADYNNPHDICLWVGRYIGAHQDDPVPVALPPLPDNFEDADLASRPLAIRRNCCGNARVAQTQGWTPENFRYYLAAYYYYLELVDREIGRMLGAFAKRPDAADTLIVFSSDHGDAMASHKMVTKGGHFYEETTRVPLIFAGGGISSHGREIGGTPVSLIDLLPTLCDYANIQPPPNLPGKSFLPFLENRGKTKEADYIVSTWLGGGNLITPARMIRTPRYKYTHFREDNGEELYDLANDPGEKRNLAPDSKFAAVLDQHRKLLRDHVAKTGDTYFNEPVVVKKGLRTHADGMCPMKQ
jgi:choline-sulfatase